MANTKQFSTTIEPTVSTDFENACRSNNTTMSKVLTEFMKHYSEGYTITYSKEVKNK